MKRLAALGIVGTWEGEWQRAQGNEREVIAFPIGEGESVALEVETLDKTIHRIGLSARRTILDITFSRYRIVKDASRAIASLPTTVEMILGSPST